MRVSFISTTPALIFCSLLLTFYSANAQQAPGETEESVPFTMRNIGAGKQLYAGLCASCHGVDGRGDTSYREFLKTPPADLTDDAWEHGSSDQEIFDVIKHGRLDRDMPGFEAQTSDKRIWYLVHYVQYLGGKRPL